MINESIQTYLNTSILDTFSEQAFNTASKIPHLSNIYLQSLFLFIFFFVVYKIFSFLIELGLERFAKKHKEKIEMTLLKKVRRPIYYGLLFLWLKVILVKLNLGVFFENIVAQSTAFIFLVIFFYVLYNATDIFFKVWAMTWVKKTESTLDDELVPLLRKFFKFMVIIIAIIMILSTWGVNVSGIVAGLGIAGIAIGLALKDSLANIFGGISLIFDQAFKVGDVIKLPNGDTGEVVDIGLRSTRIRNINNELLIIPNGVLGNATVMNFKLPDLSVRVVIPFSAKIGSDHIKIKNMVLEILKKTGRKNVIMDDKDKEPKVNLAELGTENIKFEAVFWVDNFDDKGSTKERIICDIYSVLKKNKIQFK